MNKIVLVTKILGLGLWVLAIPSLSWAHAPGVVLSAFGTATIDGQLSSGEWDSAAKFDFLINVPLADGGGTTPATLFVMNDGTNLYLGVRVTRPQLNTGDLGLGLDQVAFEFDNNHNEGPPEEGDDILLLSPGINAFGLSTFFDEVRTTRPPCPSGVGTCGFLDVQLSVPGTNDGAGAATNNGTFSFFEMSHPLDSGDRLNDFRLTPGNTVGFSLLVNLSSLTPFCSSNCSASTPFPSSGGRGDIVIASPVIGVSIDIKPGGSPNSINPKSRGKIPVAILSSSAFHAPSEVDKNSLTFGRTGDEVSLAFCNSSAEDVNSDGLLDLVCHFDTQAAGFQPEDTMGVLKGQTISGTPLTGTDSVLIVNRPSSYR